MDPRRVFKWKHRNGPDGRAAQVMRCRGFRDAGAGASATFAVTAKRASQRPLPAEAARRPDRAR
eukprot:1713054-Pyramimonas_sp.AAC.1